jgi:hypothetical protein
MNPIIMDANQFVEYVDRRIKEVRAALNGFKEPLVHGSPKTVIWEPERATHQCGDCGAKWEYIPPYDVATTPPTHFGASWSVRSPQWGACCEGPMNNMIPLTPENGIVEAVL